MAVVFAALLICSASRTATSLDCASLVLPLIASIQAFPLVVGLSEFRDYFPNGYNLDDKEFGHVADTTIGQSSEGGSNANNVITFGHNQFGRDYAAAEDTWNTFLCALDSDGDGQSNGMELGDPCCQWQSSNYQGDGLRNYTEIDISSPGRARYVSGRSSSGTCEDVRSSQCHRFSWNRLSVAASVESPPPDSNACIVPLPERRLLAVSDVSHSTESELDSQRAGVTWIGQVDEANETISWTLAVSAEAGPSMVGQCAGVGFHEGSQSVLLFGGLKYCNCSTVQRSKSKPFLLLVLQVSMERGEPSAKLGYFRWYLKHGRKCQTRS